MTDPATTLIYRAAGSPPLPGDVIGICSLCGTTGRGEAFAGWVKDTFNDYDKLAPGDIICHACRFCCGEASTLLAEKVGKDKPQRMRNYSHFVTAGGEWLALSKGDKGRMVETLRGGPVVAVIAVSGQKHITFRARPGWWQIEEHSILPFPAVLWPLLADVERLYNGGFSKGEIETGRYVQRRMMQFGLVQFLEIEARLRPNRGTLPLEFALFLAQRSETDDGESVDAERVRGLPGAIPDGAESAGSLMARDSGRLQAPVRPQHLATVRGQPARGGLHRQPEQVRQLDLFPDADSDQR